MPVNCLNCGAAIPPADIDERTSVAKCPACGKLFLKKDLAGAAWADFRMPEVEKPGRFSVRRECGDLVISFRWLSLASVDLVMTAFLAALADGFALFAGSAMLKSAPQLFKGLPLPAAALFAGLALLPAALGAFLTYYAAAGFVNTTFIRLSRGGLTVRSGPLPWAGDRAILKSGLARLSCVQKTTPRHHIKYYKLLAVMRDGSETELFPRFYVQEEALFIEQQAAAVFGSKDQAKGTGEERLQA